MAQTTQSAPALPGLNVSRLLIRLGLPVLALLALAGFLLYYFHLPPFPRFAPETAPMPTSAAIEERWGIRFTQVAVTADGGMLDVRYVVIDPSKAAVVATDSQDTPLIEIPNTQTMIGMNGSMPHKDSIQAGVTYFLLYLNADGLIKSHEYITIKLGDQVLENVPVR